MPRLGHGVQTTLNSMEPMQNKTATASLAMSGWLDMHGLKELLQLRLSRIKPEHLWVHVLNIPATRDEIQREMMWFRSGFKFTLLLDPDISPFRLDLTPLQGINVHIVGTDKAKCLNAFKACKNHAKRTLTAGSDWFMDTGAVQ